MITLLDESDVDDLIELEGVCFGYRWTRDQFFLGLKQGAYRVYGRRRRGALIGYIAFSVVVDEMEILNLAVHPKHRRQGVGSKLLEQALTVSKRLGVASAFLEVKTSNAEAIALYTAYGYERVGLRKRYYPDTKEDALLMRLDFSGETQKVAQ